MYIGILEDDPVQRELLIHIVQQAGHSCRGFGTIQSYLEGLKQESFELALIDWMLPDGTGAEALQWIRKNIGWQLPSIVITAQEEEETVVAALEAGADDYIVKPAKPLELMARIGAAMRRARPSAMQVLRAGDYEINIESQKLSIAGVAIELTQKEFDLAICIFQNLGKLLSRDYLLNKVWGISADVDVRTVDTHVSRLRRKLSLDGSRGWKMVPIYGFGYRFERVD